MKSKDQILLENIYDKLGPQKTPNEYNSFVSDEGDKINVAVEKLLKEYITNALKNDAVSAHFKNNKGLEIIYHDDRYQAIQNLLVDFQKNSNIKMNSSDIDKMARQIAQDIEDEDNRQYEEDEAERYERFRDSYS